MAAKKIITVLVLLCMFSAQLFADQPKRSKFRAVTHWVATHKTAVVIGAGTAAASGFAAWKLTRPQSPPIINLGPAVPCPSGGCITVGK